MSSLKITSAAPYQHPTKADTPVQPSGTSLARPAPGSLGAQVLERMHSEQRIFRDHLDVKPTSITPPQYAASGSPGALSSAQAPTPRFFPVPPRPSALETNISSVVQFIHHDGADALEFLGIPPRSAQASDLGDQSLSSQAFSLAFAVGLGMNVLGRGAHRSPRLMHFSGQAIKMRKLTTQLSLNQRKIASISKEITAVKAGLESLDIAIETSAVALIKPKQRFEQLSHQQMRNTRLLKDAHFQAALAAAQNELAIHQGPVQTLHAARGRLLRKSKTLHQTLDTLNAQTARLEAQRKVNDAPPPVGDAPSLATLNQNITRKMRQLNSKEKERAALRSQLDRADEKVERASIQYDDALRAAGQTT
ncbi:MAG TPA: hypothetical protein PLQ67_07210, partial [Burkholderiaceae bacterium]|nr:hypothetical protein [Burkholderiaceae bacterium]